MTTMKLRTAKPYAYPMGHILSLEALLRRFIHWPLSERNIADPSRYERVPTLSTWSVQFQMYHFNTLRPKQNGRHFADDILKCIFWNENVWIPNNISLKFVPKGPINNNAALVQVMAWRREGDKPLSESMMVRLPTHICVTRPQLVKLMYWSCRYPQMSNILL